MGIQINKLTNGVVYIDGRKYLGVVEELTMPDVKVKTATHKALGLAGDMEFPTGFEKLEGTIKWAGPYSEAFALSSDPFSYHQISVRGNLEVYNSAEGRSEQVAVVFQGTCSFRNVNLGAMKQHDNWDASASLSFTQVSVRFGDTTVMEYDAMANIYKVSGVDLLASFKANTGAF